MSTTTILGFKPDGEYEAAAEFRNSFGSAMMVWRSLALRYLQIDGYLGDAEYGRIWALYEDPRLDDTEKRTLEMTLDGAILLAADREQMGYHLHQFADRYQRRDKVCTLRDQANFLMGDEAAKYIAFAWIQTSVADDYWHRWDDSVDLDGIKHQFNLFKMPDENRGIRGFLMYDRKQVLQ